MSDAFKCDECEEYADGDPAEKLYIHVHHAGRTETEIRAELCEECSRAFAGGPPEDRYD